MVKKEFILSTLRECYEKTSEIPKSTDKFPFGVSTVRRKFGTWNNALLLADIPLRKDTKNYIKKQIVLCQECNTEFKKEGCEIKRTKNNFCSKSCSASYNNRNKKHGCNISKLELYLQEYLSGYNFEYNNRIVCDGLELDIYIDELKLAFEINGMVHYKPIYGDEKFEDIIKKDKLKNNLAKEKNITLHTIKNEKNFDHKYGKKVLERIYFLIHKHKFNNTLLLILD